jgi:hypothetical protein
MKNLRGTFLVLMALVLLISGSGFTRLNSYTGFCADWHVVRKGESLDTISRDYGISRAELVTLNKLSNPRRVYPGQRLCISTGSTPNSARYVHKPGVPPSARHDPDSKYYVHPGHDYQPTYYHPPKHEFNYGCAYDHEFHAECECHDWYEDEWSTCHDVDYDNYDCWCSDYIKKDYEYKGHYWYGHKEYKKKYSEYKGIPTITIVAVKRDKKVTFRTHNYPAGYKFNIYMGPSGSKGKHGYYAGSFHSTNPGSFTVTAKIPSQLHGLKKIAIRTESTTGGFYSYNWFYNQTTH